MGATTLSNQTGELSGLGEALLFFKYFSDRAALTIYSDSQWAINVTMGQSNAKEHKALAKFVSDLYKELERRVTLVWVQSHSGHRWNEWADKLADFGMESCCQVGRYGTEAPRRNGFPEDADATTSTSPRRTHTLPPPRPAPTSTLATISKSPPGGGASETVDLMSSSGSEEEAEAEGAPPHTGSRVSEEFISSCRAHGHPTKASLQASRWTLIPAEEAHRAALIVNGKRTEEILIKKFDVSITRSHLCCLKLKPGSSLHNGLPDQYLNDEVVNFYGEMLSERDKILCGIDPSRRRSKIFSPFFMEKILRTDKRYTFANVQRWTKRLPDIQGLSALYFPICWGAHWTLAVIRMQRKRLEYYDSGGGSGRQYLDTLWLWMVDESAAKRLPTPIKQEWTFEPRSPTPQQGNDVDCGVFATMVMDRLLEDLDLDFAHAHKDFLRQKITTDILRGSLTYPYCADDGPPPSLLSPPAPSPAPHPAPHPAPNPAPLPQPARRRAQGKALIGASVSKDFADETSGVTRSFTGTVTGYANRWYKISYEDGDAEELEWSQLSPLLTPALPTPTSEQPTSTSANEGFSVTPSTASAAVFLLPPSPSLP